MAIENIPINSGTGPKVAVDLVGTDSYQVMKVSTGADGTGGGLWNGSVGVSAISTVSNVLTVGTLLGTIAVSGGGGGVQYTRDTTSIGATGTGTLVLGVNATTVKGIVLSASGELEVNTIGSLTTGTVDVVSMPVLSATNITVANITTGTVTSLPSGTQDSNVVNTVTISGSATALPSGTQDVSVTNTPTVTVSTNLGTAVVTAANVTVASVTTGTMTTLPTGTQTTLATHTNVLRGFTVETNSSNAIVITSGAHTIYVTDLMFSVDIPTRIDFFSAATTFGSVYLATKGGFTWSLSTPLVLNSNQSLTFTPSASGSCAAHAVGYSVT